ncbi:MAG: DUF2141 domain-containing protein [Bacteroidetes bacterium]|nr:DUF2141 domain-containing protein [Bacteroidota bacterium]
MKKSFFCLYSGLLLCMMSVCCVKVAFSQSTQMLQFKGLENKKGKLYIGWFQRDEDFTKPDKAVFSKIVPITGSTAATLDVPFDNIPDGTYAVSVFLDENDNGKLDANGFGIPKEDYGFSNNVRPLTRAANFNESKFVVKGKGAPIVIEVK